MNLRVRAAVAAFAAIVHAPPGQDAALLERLSPVGYWNLLKKAIKR